ncbi:hypothetical protein B0H12DRAFT_1242589 [Mycena haematopus]|nr:hypothetical protein B0H12DRAFT_1242589 [Mycena haematopus]
MPEPRFAFHRGRGGVPPVMLTLYSRLNVLDDYNIDVEFESPEDLQAFSDAINSCKAPPSQLWTKIYILGDSEGSAVNPTAPTAYFLRSGHPLHSTVNDVFTSLAYSDAGQILDTSAPSTPHPTQTCDTTLESPPQFDNLGRLYKYRSNPGYISTISTNVAGCITGSRGLDL